MTRDRRMCLASRCVAGRRSTPGGDLLSPLSIIDNRPAGPAVSRRGETAIRDAPESRIFYDLLARRTFGSLSRCSPRYSSLLNNNSPPRTHHALTHAHVLTYAYGCARARVTLREPANRHRCRRRRIPRRKSRSRSSTDSGRPFSSPFVHPHRRCYCVSRQTGTCFFMAVAAHGENSGFSIRISSCKRRRGSNYI